MNNIKIGGKVPSYDEKHYNEGIIRDKIGECEGNLCKFEDFKYYYVKDKKEVSKEDLERIRGLNVPRSIEYVWITRDKESELQGIFIDKNGKKQYIYTKEHKDKSAEHKFGNLKLFIELIPKINKLIEEKNKLDRYDKEKVLITILEIILLTGIRCGKEQYAQKENSTYGIISLRKKHIKMKEGKVYLEFTGKKSVEHRHKITDETIIKELEELSKLEGNKDDKIFRYKENNEIKNIYELDMNNFIHEKIHKDIVIKDLRTYLVNYLIIKNLREMTTRGKIETQKGVKSIVKEAINKTADYIQHTPAICKKSYINPIIIEKYIKDPKVFIKNKDKTILEFMKELIS